MLKSWVLFFFAVLFFGFACISLATSSKEIFGIKVTNRERVFMLWGNTRNLKEASCEENCDTTASLNKGELVMEDYGPVDPSPTTKASIRPGPIQHGSPLNPYIPKPPCSPTHPKDGG